MGEIIVVGKTGDLEDGDRKKVTAQGKEILITRVGDEYFATDNRCSHLGGDLSAGKLEGTVVTCPRHGSRFDLRNGDVVRWMKGSGIISTLGKAFKPPKALHTYTVSVESDEIKVEI
jgi:3-phenylpropionate/trans-cinnamate dioxygenase ferredoxin subunit